MFKFLKELLFKDRTSDHVFRISHYDNCGNDLFEYTQLQILSCISYEFEIKCIIKNYNSIKTVIDIASKNELCNSIKIICNKFPESIITSDKVTIHIISNKPKYQGILIGSNEVLYDKGKNMATVVLNCSDPSIKLYNDYWNKLLNSN